MKHFFSCFAIAALLFNSCDTPSEPAVAPPTEQKASALATGCDPATPQVIDLNTASNLILEFMRSTKGQSDRVNFGIGSYISREQLRTAGLSENKATDPTAGVFIYDMINGFNQGQFALRFGSVCKAGERAEYEIVSNENHYVTHALLLYDNENPQASEISNYIQNQGIKRSIAYNEHDPIGGDKVVERNSRLLTDLGGQSSFSSNGCYFFNLDDFDRVIRNNPTENIIGFAICRGIEKINENGQDKFYDRLILIGVNKNGEFVHTGNQIMERSWPPRGF